MIIARLRSASGLILFAFILSHLINHAVGLVSLETANDGLEIFRVVWSNPLSNLLLMAAFIVHLVIALISLYRRRTLRMRPWEAAQLLLGLLIPVLLAEHVIGTMGAARAFGVETDYIYLQTVFWIALPASGIQQVIVLVLAWTHGCIGLHYWWQLKPWYAAAVPVLYAAAVLVPALALAGIVSSGFEILALAEQVPDFVDQVFERAKLTRESIDFVVTGTGWFQWGFAAVVAAVLAARWVPYAVRRIAGAPRLTYPGDRMVSIQPGLTVLEASRAAGIPHASVCGGRGRCSTCRIRVGAGAENLPAASPDEQKVLRRIGAPPDVRLACQLRPSHDLAVTPLLPPTASARDASPRAEYLSGQEREIAILFADLRGFTSFSDAKLPYDVVFVLNRYFSLMGQAVELSGGRIDKFIGDGVMALFGVESGAPEGCRRALIAARAMAESLEELNRSLGEDLPSPLRMGIGIHVGPVIVGEMGYGRAKSLTAIGDAVNTASRLEGLTKEFGAQLVVSEDVFHRAEVGTDGFESRVTEVRGKKDGMTVWVTGTLAPPPAKS